MPEISDVLELPQLYRLREGLPLVEIEKRVGVAYAGAGLRHRVVCFYLQDVDARGLHQLAGCRTVTQWAALRFGMSRRETRDLLEAGAPPRPGPRQPSVHAMRQPAAHA